MDSSDDNLSFGHFLKFLVIIFNLFAAMAIIDHKINGPIKVSNVLLQLSLIQLFIFKFSNHIQNHIFLK